MTTKVCKKCRKEKPATTEFFTKQKTGKYGLTQPCKVCRSKRRRVKKVRHKCPLCLSSFYPKGNNQKCCSQTCQWRHYRKTHPEVAVNMKEWRLKNSEHLSEYATEYSRIYRSKNHEKLKERTRAYLRKQYRLNPEKAKAKRSICYQSQMSKLTDGYIRPMLKRQGLGLSTKDIELKRLTIQLKRAIYEKQRAIESR